MMATELNPCRTVGRIDVLDWLPEELEAWDVPEVLPTADWVERHVRIPGHDAAIPGPVDLNLTPYLRPIFDAIDNPRVDTITGMFGTQLGKTLSLYSIMMSLTCQRPGPILLVMPTEPDAREVAGGQLKNHVLECAPMLDLLPGDRGDLTKEGYRLRNCSWYFGWSNSPASLARRACRYVMYDEVDKFPPFVGRESDPLRLGDGRMRTYRNTLGTKSIRFSSPTDATGLIHKSYQQSDQGTVHVPCPHCGRWQVLTWQHVYIERDDAGNTLDPALVRSNDLAWIVCCECHTRWSEAERLAAVRACRWVPSGQRVDRAGRVIGNARRPDYHHFGIHVSALYSGFTTLGELAADWLEANHGQDLSALKSFVQQQLGEIWTEKQADVDRDKLQSPDRHDAYRVGQCPGGVQVVVTTVDCQRGYYVIETRGWGHRLESWILDARIIQTDEQLAGYLADERFGRVDPQGQPVEGAEAESIRHTLIDAGDDTARIYDLCARLRGQGLDISPTMGHGSWRAAHKVRSSPIRKNPRTQRSYRGQVMRYDFEADYHKDVQARLAEVAQPGPGYLHLPCDLPEQWFRQFTAEHKVTDRSRYRRGWSGRPRTTWKPKSEGAANHYWDCAVLQCVAADVFRLRHLPAPGATTHSSAVRPASVSNVSKPSIRTSY